MGVLKRQIKRKDGIKSTYWYIRYQLNGKDKWESVGKVGEVTKAVAQTKLEERKRQIRLGESDMINAEIPILSEFSKEYLEYITKVKQNRSYRRSHQALNHFISLLGNKKLSEITVEDIDIYKSRRLKENAKPASVNRELAVLKNLFNTAYKWRKFFGRNPVSLSGLLEVHNQIERILTLEEEMRLLEASSGYLKDIIQIALNSGMRQGEILALEWEWIDLNNNLIFLPQTNTKNKKINKVPVNQIVRTILLNRKIAVEQSEFVFPSPQGLDKHITWLRRPFETACKKAGISGLRFHDFRHTAATRAVDAGIPLHAVSKLLGHSSVRITERYSHPEASVQKAVEILGNFTNNCSNNCSSKDLAILESDVTP